MTTSVLNRIEESLSDFRPKTQREFVALQIAKRFNDLERLANYVNAAQKHSKKVLLEAARLATKRADESGTPAKTILFELLEQFGEGTTV